MSTATSPAVEEAAAIDAQALEKSPAGGHAPIPFRTVAGVELRKMFDTRSGFWLIAGIAATGLIASIAVVLFASDSGLTYDSFAGAVGVPMTILLPVLAILSVTSEWSQRAGLTTFTLVPHRGRVIRAKLAVTLAVGVASMAVALAIGAIGNVVGADLLGMLVGFMLGVVTRNSAAAIVGYFVYWFVFPTLSMLLANNNAWFAKAQPWLDFGFKQNSLYDGGFTGQDWAQLALTGSVWLLLPLAFGVWRMLRSEVK